MRWKLYRHSFSIIKTMILTVLICSAVHAEIKVLESGISGVTLRYESETLELDTLSVNSKTYEKLESKHSLTWDTPGDPGVLVYSCVIGVPPEGEINISFLGSVKDNQIKLRLLPVAETIEQDDLSKNIYKEGDIYRQSSSFPGKLYTMNPPEFSGQFRIVRISFYPTQYHPKDEKIDIYRSIDIRINFEIPGETGSEHLPEERLSVYKNMLLNYNDAKNWSKPKSRFLKKERMIQSGSWYRIPVSGSEEGIYRITGSWLAEKGINISSIDPKTLKIYNNGGQELPRDIEDSRVDGWLENPISVSGEDDGEFNSGDYLLFYGKGIQNVEYDITSNTFKHYNNIYTDENIYFLVFNDGQNGKRIQSLDESISADPVSINQFTDLIFHEEDKTNLVAGGTYWMGQTFTSTNQNFTLSLPFVDGVPDEDVQVEIYLNGGGVYKTHNFQLYLENTLISSISKRTGLFFSTTAIATDVNTDASKNLTLRYLNTEAEALAYLDWIHIYYKRQIKASNHYIKFFSPLTGNYTSLKYEITNFQTKPEVWNITDPGNIYSMNVTPDEGNWTCMENMEGKTPQTYYAFTSDGFKTPSQITQEEISALRNQSNRADYLIITHSNFLDAARELKEYRESHDGFTVFIADIQNVYDEFSCGLVDPVAIRNLVFYSVNEWELAPRYLLLLGDGNYDYRQRLSLSPKTYVPPFEYTGTDKDVARATDDFFVYVNGNDKIVDLATGRLNVNSNEEAHAYIQKLIKYETEPQYGIWKKTVTFVGDDEYTPDSINETNHTKAVEYMAQHYFPQYFDPKKIYLFEYPLEKSIGFDQKPKANEALIDQLNRGTVFVDYVGHGNESVWAHESVFEISRDLSQLSNAGKLPMYYAATCAFGFYDNPYAQSFSEALVLADSTGGIAVISASRFCNADQNENLNETFLLQLFSNDHDYPRIGDAFRTAKTIYTSSISNNEKYHIFGDPALRLAFPEKEAEITYFEPDSFKALSVFKIEGNTEENFNGNLILSAFDSYKDISYTAAGGGIARYKLPGNSIFRGEGSIENGDFQMAFVVPKDISYSGTTGRLSLYFWDETTDGIAYQNDIPVGGSADIIDHDEPEIQIYFSNHENFISGDMVEADPQLIAEIRDDKTGINLTGEIGHTMSLTLDDEEAKDITEYFQYNENSYLAGKVLYDLNGLAEGTHTITLKAWDNANNSSTQTVSLEIIPKGKLQITRILNYPNPFDNSGTHLTFHSSHDTEIVIKIFTVSGRLIRKLDNLQGEAGFNMFFWDGRDEMGDLIANGVYLYKISAETSLDGEIKKTSKIGRAMLSR